MTRLPEGLRAAVFDMDGTLIDSFYDWPAIRAELKVDAASIIDALAALPHPEREERWRRLREIEAQATASASLIEGARELVDLFRVRGFKTALVTNNSRRNATTLLERFSLAFDLVLTRDDGFWKPDGAPLIEAARRLGVAPAECLALGDNRYDLDAARAGKYGFVVILNRRAEDFGDADACLPDVVELLRRLRQSP